MKLKDYFLSNAKKLIIAILFLFISILISTHIFSWKNKFQLTYNGILGEENAEYYSYEIKNKTNNTLSNVIAVVEVKMVTGKFKIDYPISISMKAGQTKTIKIPQEDIKDYAEYYDVYLLFPEINIIKIKYNGKAYDYTISNEIEKFKKQKQIDIVKNIDKKLGGTIDVKLNDLISYIEYYDSIYTTVRGCVASISDDNKELQLYNCDDRSRTIDIHLYEKEKNIDIDEEIFVKGRLSIYNKEVQIYVGILLDNYNSEFISVNKALNKAIKLNETSFNVDGTILNIKENIITSAEIVQERFKGYDSFKIGILKNYDNIKIYDKVNLTCKMNSLDSRYFNECTIN